MVDRVHNTPEGFSSLTDDEKTYFAVSCLEGEVYNGGFSQFFSNNSGELYAEAVIGLEKLNAPRSQNLLQRGAAILFDDIVPPTDRERRWELIKRHSDIDEEPLPAWCSELEELEKQYWDDPDNLSKLLADFAEDAGLLEPFKPFRC